MDLGKQIRELEVEAPTEPVKIEKPVPEPVPDHEPEEAPV